MNQTRILIMRKIFLFFCPLFTILFILPTVKAQVKIITTAVNSAGTGAFVDNVPATAGRINGPYLICVDAADNLYIADFNNARVRKVDAISKTITTVAGSASTGSFGDGGPATAAQLGVAVGNRGVVGVAVDASGNIYIGDATNNKIRMVDAATGIINTIAGDGIGAFTGDGGPASAAQLNGPRGIAIDPAGNIYFSDAENNRIRKIAAGTGIITTIAGNGTSGYVADGVAATTTRINSVRGLTVDASGNVYIADQGNNRIRRIDAVTNIITTVAGTGTAGNGTSGPATAAQISGPLDVKFDAAGNLYIADAGNQRIKMVNTSGIISVVAGGSSTGGYAGDGQAATASAVRMNTPASIAILSNANYFYISDRNNNRIRLVKPNSLPYFPGGATASLVVCQNSTSNSYGAVVPAVDSDLNQTLTWSVTSAALHGTATGPATAATTGAAITPTGLTYTPTSGYSGNDTFTVQVSDGFNTASVQVLVTVNPLPVVPAIGGPSTVCVGAIVTETNTTTGGLWQASNSNVSIGSASGDVTGVSVGTVTISYTVTNACGFTRVVRIMTVNNVPATPAAITGSTPICAGNSIILSDATPSGTWTSSNTAVATVGSLSGSVTGVTSGTADITYTVSNTCGNSFVTTTVTVNTSPSSISGSSSSCTGSSNTLTASPVGTWASSNTAAATIGSTSGIVTGVAAGNTTISYTLSNGCFSTLAVTVNNPPSANGGIPTVCIGGTTTLTNSGGGTWSSGSANATVGSASGIVTGVSAGTAVITYSLSGCIATTTVTVNNNPSPITPPGAISVCVGATTALADATPGGTWSSGATGTATVVGGTVTGVSAGTVNISYTNASGCSAVKTITVAVTPAALSPSSTAVCIGSTVTITNSVGGGAWTSSASGTASVAGGIVTGVAAGTARITYTIGSCFVTAPVTVNTNPSAITPPSAISLCVGGTTVLSDATPGGTWSSGATSVATVAGGTVTAAGSGVATISYTNAVGCSATKDITVNSTPAAMTPISGTVCTGNTILFTNSVSGGTWSSSASGTASVAGGLVTGVAVGTATITYTIGSCFATAPVTVNLSPSAGSIVGSSTVCVSATTMLTDAVSGGVWSSSSPGIASVGPTGLVTGVSAGSAIITYSVTNGCGTAFTTQPMTVSAAASAGTITGVGMLCAGTFTTLVASAPGGTWSVTNPRATISSAGLLTGVTPGIDTVLYTVTNACGPVSARHIVTIGAFLTAGTISGPTSVCAGSTITLSNATTGGTWTSSSAAATVSGSGVVTGISAGSPVISYTVTSFCGSATATYPITVIPMPDAGTVTGPITLCEGVSATYSTAGSGGTWSVTNSTAGITTGGVVTAISTGTDTVVYTVINACGTDESSLAVTIGPAIVVNPIAGGTAVCTGGFIILTDATPGGVWSASNTNATVAGGVVTGISSGTVDISYTVTTSCGSASATSTITVSPTPDAGTISGASAVCTGSSITLTDAAIGGTWSASNSNATVSGGIVTGISAGMVNISYTVTNSCGTASAIQTITVDTPPSAGSIAGPSNVCVGAAITLTDAIPGGIWSASNFNATVSGGFVSGMSAGLVDISYAVTNSCGTAVTAATITVDPLPDAGIITGASDVCEGASITLTDAASGGIWSASNSNATVSGGVVTGITAGTVDISYTVTNMCGTATATQFITVFPAPDAGTISGLLTVCVGTFTILTDPAIGGVWSASNTNASVSGGIVTGLSTGMVDISYTVTNTCGIAIAAVPVTVEDVPVAATITGPSSVCKTSNITLSDATPGGTWSASNTNATVTAGGIVTGVTAGSVMITYTVSNTCGTDVASKPITVTQPPSPGAITGPSSVCIGLNISLADGVMGGTWSSSNTSVATVAGGLVTGISTGSATVSYTVSNSCGSRSATYPVSVLSPTACSHVQVKTSTSTQNELKLYPNPNQGTFAVNLISDNDEPAMVTITNIIGKKVKEFSTTTNKVNDVQLNAPGIYLLTITTGNGRYVAKVTVE